MHPKYGSAAMMLHWFDTSDDAHGLTETDPEMLCVLDVQIPSLDMHSGSTIA